MQTAAEKEPKTLYRKLRSKLGKIDTRAGRMVFGDDNPLTRHIRYNLAHTAIKMRAGYKPAPGPRLFKPDGLRAKGYLVFENLYSPELVRTLSKKLAAAFDNPEAAEARHGKYSTHIKNAYIHAPEMKELITPAMINALNDYYQAYTDIGTIYTWRNFPPDANAPKGVYSSSWHTDRRTPTMLKLFYLVNDTGPDDGPFHIIDRPNTQRIIRTEYTTRLEMDSIDKQHNTYFKLTGKAGSILIGNTTMCLHKAGLPAPGHYRDIVQFTFFPSARPMPANWGEDPERYRTDLGERGL